MKLNNDLLRIIKKYLNGGETTAERMELYQWYEKTDNGKSIPNSKYLTKLYRRNKKRTLSAIQTDSGKPVSSYTIWYKVAAACFIVFGISTAIYLFFAQSNLIVVSNQELNKMVAASGKPSLTLSTGQKIELDTLELNRATHLKNATVTNTKDNGMIIRPDTTLKQELAMATLTTPRGIQYRVTLSDGTKVWLNGQSTISFPEQFGAGDRQVYLKGEAYFEVTKSLNKSKFIVNSNGQCIQVLGTKFNIKNRFGSGETKTTLLEGVVMVKPTDKRRMALILKPNQQSILNAENLKVLVVDASKIVAWKSGYFGFDGSSIEELVAEIADWYGIPVQNRSSPKSFRYAGKIPKNISLGQLQKLLSYQDINLTLYKDHNNKFQMILN